MNEPQIDKQPDAASKAPLNTSSDRSITIIGAGLVGLCSALYLQERGYTVTVIDRISPAQGCSFGNAGMLCSWGCAPLATPGMWRSIPKWVFGQDSPMSLRWGYAAQAWPWLKQLLRAGGTDRIANISDGLLKLNQPTVTLYRELLKPTGYAHLVRDASHIYCFRDKTAFNDQDPMWKLRIERGAPITIYRGHEVHEVEPDVSPEYELAVAIEDQGISVNPGLMGQVLAGRIAQQGGRFHQGDVSAISRTDTGYTIHSDHSDFHCQKLLITSGAWSHRLTADLGVRIPLETERGYHVTFANSGVSLNNNVMDGERYFAMTPMSMGIRVAGTTEFAGLEAPPNVSRNEMLVRLAKQVLPGLNTEDASYWMGHRPSLPDSLPVIDSLPGHPNVFAGFGHGHLGLTGAPMTGRLLAALVAGERTDVDMEPYKAGRFQSG